jgi:hypothetical protein
VGTSAYLANTREEEKCRSTVKGVQDWFAADAQICAFRFLLNFTPTVYLPVSGEVRSRSLHVTYRVSPLIRFSHKTYRPSPKKDATWKDPPLIWGPLIGGYTVHAN